MQPCIWFAGAGQKETIRHARLDCEILDIVQHDFHGIHFTHKFLYCVSLYNTFTVLLFKFYISQFQAIFHKTVDSRTKTSGANACIKNIVTNFLTIMGMIPQCSQTFREVRC